MFFILLLFVGSVGSVGANTSEIADPFPNDRLLFVHSIYRHGDRTPQRSFPKDLYTESDWPVPFGELTPLGFQQQINLGKWLRKRYVEQLHFLSSHYNSTEIYAQSTDFNRTIQSATANLIGLFGNSTFPPPVHSVSRQNDPVGTPQDGCARVRSLMELVWKTPESRSAQDDNKGLFERMEKLMGLSVIKFRNFSAVSDPIRIEEIHKMKLASGLKALFPDIQRVTVDNYKLYYGYGIQSESMEPFEGLDMHTELPKAWGGPMLFEIIKRMEQKIRCSENSTTDCDWIRRRLFHSYSTHDTTLMALLSTFGFDQLDYNRNDVPNFAAMILVELWENADDNSTYVKIYYRRSESEIFDLSNSISGCEHTPFGCSLVEFRNRSKAFLPEGGIQKMCDSPVKTSK